MIYKQYYPSGNFYINTIEYEKDGWWYYIETFRSEKEFEKVFKGKFSDFYNINDYFDNVFFEKNRIGLKYPIGESQQINFFDLWKYYNTLKKDKHYGGKHALTRSKFIIDGYNMIDTFVKIEGKIYLKKVDYLVYNYHNRLQNYNETFLVEYCLDTKLIHLLPDVFLPIIPRLKRLRK